MKLKKILILFIAMVMMILSFSSVKTSADDTSFNYLENEVLESATLAKGVSWKKINSAITSETGKNTTPLINYVSAKPGNAMLVGWAKVGSTGISGGGTLLIARDYEATHPNYIVLAAVNGDFFGSTNSCNTTRDPLIIDGMLLSATPDTTAKARLTSMGVNEDLSRQYNGYPYLLTKAGEQLNISKNFFLDILDSTGSYVIKTIELGEDTKFIYKEEYTKAENEKLYTIATTSDFDISTSTGYQNKVGSTRFVAGSVNGEATTLSASEVAIATTNERIIELMAKQPKVRVYHKAVDKYANFNTLFGAPQQTVKDGQMVATDDVVNYGSHRDLLRARTAIGFKADGTAVLITVDEVNSSGSYGATVREVGYILNQLGCRTAFNFDGGGSTTFVVRKNNELVCVNEPSDGPIRGTCNAVMVVVPRTTANLELTQEWAMNGYSLVKGSFNLAAQNNFEYTKAEILIDGEPTGQDANNFELKLASGKEYDIEVLVTYLNGATEVSKVFHNETLVTESFPEKTEPGSSMFKVSEEDDKVTYTFEVIDPDNLVTEVLLENDSESYKLEKVDGLYSYIFNPTEDTTYIYHVTYKYIWGEEVVTKTDDLEVIYKLPKNPIFKSISLNGTSDKKYEVTGLEYEANTTEVKEIIL